MTYFYKKDVNEVIDLLDSSIDGLSDIDANNRLLKYGKNIISTGKRKSIFSLFIEEVKSPLTITLIVTAIISFLINEKLDACVILGIVMVDSIIGVVQEYKSLKSAESLSKMLVTKSKVIRDGKIKEINAEDLVIGDIIVLDSGLSLTSDARIIESDNLNIDESVLTGESYNVEKNNKVILNDTILANRKNMVYAGSNVMTGRGKAIVVATSFNTELGKIAKTVNETVSEKSPLTIRMNRFSKQINLILIVIAILTTMIMLSSGVKKEDIFLAVIALVVSAMPEGLTLAKTLALTVASNKMAKENVIVKKLNSVESLGSCTVIASDKTGTLTVNKQTAKKIILTTGDKYDITGEGYSETGKIIGNRKNLEKIERLVNLCAVNNEAEYNSDEDYFGDSIDVAFKVLQKKLNYNSNYKIKKIIPYESEKGYSAVYYEEDGKLRCTVKGSIEKLIEFSKNDDFITNENDKLTKNGYRTIAVCDGEVKDIKKISGLELFGIVGFIDPVRKESIDAVKMCRLAGIKVLMVTGDHPNTSLQVAKELGIATKKEQVITGVELDSAYKKGNEYFDNVIKSKTVFSRVTPLDKLHIVESLERSGEFVAVTGDGVNDAPAIKKANIGIAMGSGTDVAKDSANMIIIDDNFSSIVKGIKEGRIAYSNIRKIVLFLLSCGFSEVLFFIMSIVFGYDMPLVAIQLLWLNLVTDGLQDIALSFEKESDDIMMEKPRSTKESIFNSELFLEILIYGLTISIIVFGFFKKLVDSNVDIVTARTLIMLLMVFIQNLHVLNCRSEKKSIFRTKILNNPLVIITIISSLILEVIVTEIPIIASILKINAIDFNMVFGTFMLSIIIIIVGEFYKYLKKII